MERGDGAETRRGSFITLSQPRPGTARRLNEYIESPLRPPPPLPRLKESRGRPPVTSQPKSEKPPAVADESILCRRCRRCRCESCKQPRTLPQRWICNNKCLCSTSSVVDYCSCMCCVRGLFYHWTKDSESDGDVSCADKPCSCAPHKRLARWGCMGLLSLPLPCLCCYWPLKATAVAANTCYSVCVPRVGCRCPPHRTLLEAEC